MALQTLLVNADISQPSSPYKNTGTYYYAAIDDNSTAEYIASAYDSNNYWIFGMQEPTAHAGLAPTKLTFIFRFNKTGTDWWLTGLFRLYINISLNGTDWLGEQMWTPWSNKTFQAGFNYETATLVYLLPDGTTFASITDLRLKVRFDCTDTGLFVNPNCTGKDLYWYSVDIQMDEGLTIVLTESADTLALGFESDYETSQIAINPAGTGYIMVAALIACIIAGNPAITKYRVQIDSDPAFGSVEIDSGDITAAGEDSGDTIRTIVTGTLSTAGTYYVRVGTATTNLPTLRYSAGQTFIVDFPGTPTITIEHVGSHYTVTVSVDDNYLDPPEVGVIVDGQSSQARLQ